MNLHEESKMMVIKGISEVATKEYSANSGLDSLDKDVKSAEFTLSPYKETNTLIVLKVGELITMFSEYKTRAIILMSNPYVKNFFEKL